MTRARDAGPRRDPDTGTWGFVVDVGRDPRTGRRRQARRRGYATRKAAQEALDTLRHEARTATYVPRADQNVTLADYLRETWLPAVQGELQPSTWASYRRYLELHVIPAKGGLRLADLAPSTLTTLYAAMRAEGARRDGKPGGLSPRTVRYVATILKKALSDAVTDGLLVRNPADGARLPGRDEARPFEHGTWSAAQLGRFLAFMEGNRYHAAFHFLATTGCRRGEALGLRLRDVDLDSGRCSIRQTVTSVEHRIVVAPRTKTGGARAVDLDAETVAVLRAWSARQAEEHLALGLGRPGPDTLVFSFPGGRPYDPEKFSREFDRKLERFNRTHADDPLPRIRLHDLRHTWATLALQAGVPTRVVSERLGHASTAITENVYQHVTPTMQADAAEKVAGLIFRTPR